MLNLRENINLFRIIILYVFQNPVFIIFVALLKNARRHVRVPVDIRTTISKKKTLFILFLSEMNGFKFHVIRSTPVFLRFQSLFYPITVFAVIFRKITYNRGR